MTQRSSFFVVALACAAVAALLVGACAFGLGYLLKIREGRRRVVFFAPLYVSNVCANNCLYCAFRRDNEELEGWDWIRPSACSFFSRNASGTCL